MGGKGSSLSLACKMEELVSFFVTVVIDIAWLTKGVFFCIIYLFEVFLEVSVSCIAKKAG